MKHMLEPPPAIRILRPAVPAEIESALDKALAKTATDRFESTSEFVSALETPAEVIAPQPPEAVVEPEKIVEVPKPVEARKDVKAPPEEKEKPVRLTKIKFKSQTDIEKEMEKLAEEFSHK